MKRADFLLIAAFAALSSCAPARAPERRAAYARQKAGPVQIALVWPLAAYDDLMEEGVRLAVDEVNGRGGILGRTLELRVEDDNAEVERGLLAAETLAEDPRVMAVIGHCNSVVSLSVALTYEINSLIMLSPASTSRALSDKGYRYVFGVAPGDELTGKRAAELCGKKRLRSVAVVYSSDSYGLGLANAFEKRMGELRLKVADRCSFGEGGPAEIEHILDRLEIFTLDGFFFAGPAEAGAVFLERARERGFRQPVIGSDGLESTRILELPAAVAGDLSIVAACDPRSGRQAAAAFGEAFRERYGRLPDGRAAFGYDAVKALAGAMEEARSPDPVKAAPALRAISRYPGAAGEHRFDREGPADGKFVVAQPENRTFRYREIGGGSEE